MSGARYEALARQLVAAPDPIAAIASELGDQAGRIDAILRRLAAAEARLGFAVRLDLPTLRDPRPEDVSIKGGQL